VRPSAIIPPLGWVLAEHTRAQFDDILKYCGNLEELKALQTGSARWNPVYPQVAPSLKCAGGASIVQSLVF